MKTMKFAAKDLEVASLPSNRKEVFFDLLKYQWKKLLFCGFILFLFSLPLNLSVLSERLADISLTGQMEAGLLTEEERALAYVAFLNVKALIEIALFCLIAVGIAGVMRILRQLAWGENVLLRADLIKGIRQNAGQMLLLALIAGVFRCILILYLNNSASLGDLVWVGIVVAGVLAVVFVPVFCYMTVQIAAYSNPFRLNFRLGVTVFFKSPFRSVGMIVLLSAMFVLQYIPVYLCKLIARMLLPWLTGITILIWMLFVFNRMDRYIHPVYYPELVGKGILAREFAPREEQADQTTQKIETK